MPASIGSDLSAYNPSWWYVDGLQRYARQLPADLNALPRYYNSQLIGHLASGWFLLPPGHGTNPTRL